MSVRAKKGGKEADRWCTHVHVIILNLSLCNSNQNENHTKKERQSSFCSEGLERYHSFLRT